MTTCICSYRKQETGVDTAALFGKALMSRKACEQCGQDFLIVRDVPTQLEERDAQQRH